MKCPFCSKENDLPIVIDDIDEHLIVIINKEGKAHVHGPVDDADKMKNLIMIIANSVDIEIKDV